MNVKRQTINSPTGLLPSLLIFLYFAGTGSISPYLNIFFQTKGLSISQIAILGAMPLGLTFLAAPVWAGIADYFGLHRKILPLIIFLSIPFMILTAFFDSFLLILLAVVFYGLCSSPIMSLSDNSVLSYLGTERNRYGHIRLWGSIGWGLSGWLAGILIGRVGFAYSFIAFSVLFILDGLVARRMPEPKLEKGISYWASLRQVVYDMRWIGFLLGSFLAGTSFMFIGNYFFIFLKDLGAPSSFQGLAVASSVLLELPFFIFSASLIKKVSARGLIIFSFIVLIARLFFSSILKDPFWGVVVNMLHGPFYSTFWTGAVNYAQDIAPRGLGASAQALFAASFLGLGGVAGALLGGMLFDQFGAQAMFQVGVGLTLAGLIFFSLLRKRVPAIP